MRPQTCAPAPTFAGRSMHQVMRMRHGKRSEPASTAEDVAPLDRDAWQSGRLRTRRLHPSGSWPLAAALRPATTLDLVIDDLPLLQLLETGVADGRRMKEQDRKSTRLNS